MSAPGTPATRAAAMLLAKPLVRAIYARHGAGCCWHVVLDDNNVEDEFIRFVVRDIMGGSRFDCGGPECRALAEIAPQLSTTQWAKLGSVR